MKKKVAIYARISTNEKKQDLEVQLLPLREFCKNRGWEIAGEYCDMASGGSDSRGELKRLKEDAFCGKFDIVLVFRFDRFARSTKQLVDALEEFKAQKIDFVSYSEQIDTTSPAGKALFSLISVFAEFENSIIRERVKAGLARAKAKGVKLGRPKVKKMKLEDEIVASVQDGYSIYDTSLNLDVSTAHVKRVKQKRKDDLQQLVLT